ncbi:LytTR family DNA-binding domain-containing protein [Algoriphagus sp.]|uniref:LytR/AlgR family response regulator transcription factor n=1 Tax=Algoriphagus sp. TaxID=1872435 RepID=UPI0025D9855D|nr:LytTR family DNA-binding domain-containing protein [Algoriphagus sp.]
MEGKQQNEKQKYHPDILLFVLLIPFISAFNYYLTYSNIQLNGFLLLTYTIDTLQGFLAWWSVRSIIIFLDRKLPFEPKPSKRIAIQVFITTAVGLFLIISTTEIISFLVKGESAHISFYTLDVLIISIWFLVINAIYIGLHYQYAFKEIRDSQIATSGKKSIPVRQGKQEYLIKTDEIGFLKKEEQYIQLVTREGKRYLLDESLDYWEKELPEDDFFRLNRQSLIHRELVSGFKKLENGKLEVQLNKELDSSLELGISRTKAPSFRTWFLRNS